MNSLVPYVLSSLVLVHCKTVLINDIVDNKLVLSNRIAVESGRTTVDLGSGVSFDGVTMIGLDSFRRACNCSMELKGNSVTYNYVLRQDLHATYFRRATFYNRTGSGYYRARGNSLQYAYSVVYSGAGCGVRLNCLHFDLGKVEGCIQSKCFDDNDEFYNHFVVQQLQPMVNKKLASLSGKIKESLDMMYCGSNGGYGTDEQVTRGLDVLKSFLFE